MVNKKAAIMHWVLLGFIIALGILFSSNSKLLAVEQRGGWQLDFLEGAYLPAEKSLMENDFVARKEVQETIIELALEGGFTEEKKSACGQVLGYNLWNNPGAWCYPSVQLNSNLEYLMLKKLAKHFPEKKFSEISYGEKVVYGKGEKKTISSGNDKYIYDDSFTVSLDYSFSEYDKITIEAQKLVFSCNNATNLKNCLDQNTSSHWKYGKCENKVYLEQDRKVIFCVENLLGLKVNYKGLEKLIEYQFALNFQNDPNFKYTVSNVVAPPKVEEEDVEEDCTGKAIIKGKVIDINGNPVESPTVSIDEREYSGGRMYNTQISVFNEPDGSFETCVDANKQYFLSVNKLGYLGQYIFEKDEIPKTLNAGDVWEIEIKLEEKNNENQKEIIDGRFKVQYFAVDQKCADIGLEYAKNYYSLVKNVLGIEPEQPETRIIFRQGSGAINWLGDHYGLQTTCLPWTDEIENPQIKESWDNAIPHELAHHFTLSYLKVKKNEFFTKAVPNWFVEGIAEYTAMQILNETCDSEKYVDISNLKPGNSPQYYTAACSLIGLEEKNPGFVNQLIKTIKQKTENYDTSKEVCINNGYFIKGVMLESYGEDLTSYYVDNFFFNVELLEQEYNQCKDYWP